MPLDKLKSKVISKKDHHFPIISLFQLRLLYVCSGNYGIKCYCASFHNSAVSNDMLVARHQSLEYLYHGNTTNQDFSIFCPRSSCKTFTHIPPGLLKEAPPPYSQKLFLHMTPPLSLRHSRFALE